MDHLREVRLHLEIGTDDHHRRREDRQAMEEGEVVDEEVLDRDMEDEEVEVATEIGMTTGIIIDHGAIQGAEVRHRDEQVQGEGRKAHATQVAAGVQHPDAIAVHQEAVAGAAGGAEVTPATAVELVAGASVETEVAAGGELVDALGKGWIKLDVGRALWVLGTVVNGWTMPLYDQVERKVV